MMQRKIGSVTFIYDATGKNLSKLRILVLLLYIIGILVTYVLPLGMKVIIEEYIRRDGSSPFEKWFKRLNSMVAAKITTALYRMEQGNYSNIESVGEGIYEYKIHFGSGYRIYFGQEGAELIILVGGGSKKQQSKDIKEAKKLWREYKQEKMRAK